MLPCCRVSRPQEKRARPEARQVRGDPPREKLASDGWSLPEASFVLRPVGAAAVQVRPHAESGGLDDL